MRESSRAGTERLLALAGAGRRARRAGAGRLAARAGPTVSPGTPSSSCVGEEDPIAASELVGPARKLPARTSGEAEAQLLFGRRLRLAPVDTARAARPLPRGDRGRRPPEYASGPGRPDSGMRICVGSVAPTSCGPHGRARSCMRPVARPSESASDGDLRSQLRRPRCMLAADSVTAGVATGRPPALPRRRSRPRLLWPRRPGGQPLPTGFPSGWPDSPYAPKAILAGQQLDPAWADPRAPCSTSGTPTAPTWPSMRGEEPSATGQLEDSLRRLRSLAQLDPRAVPRSRRGAGQPAPSEDVGSRPHEAPHRRPRRGLEP